MDTISEIRAAQLEGEIVIPVSAVGHDFTVEGTDTPDSRDTANEASDPQASDAEPIDTKKPDTPQSG